MGAHFFSWIDYTCFFVITSLSCFIGLYFGVYSKPKSTTEYIFGGKNVKWLLMCLSLAAGGLSGQNFIGSTTEMYLHGCQYVFIFIPSSLANIMNYYLFFPVFCKLQVRNVFQYLEIRFNTFLKNCVVFIWLLNGMLMLSIFMYSPSLTFAQASGMDLHIIAAIMMIVCVFYTSLGGIKAVAWADTLQLMITFSTLIFVNIMGIYSIGGMEILIKRASEGQRLPTFDFNPNPTLRTSFWTIMLGYTITWSSLTSTAPTEVQRYLSVPKSSIKYLLITYTFIGTTIMLALMVLALVIYGKYFDCDPISTGEVQKSDQIVAYFITEITSHIPGFNGIFVAALFGSSLSSFSTFLNTLSGILYFDVTHWFVPKRYLKSDNEVILMKIYVVVLGVISIGLMYALEKIGTIFEIFHYIKGITGGAVFGIFLLGLLVPIANVKGAFFGGITSLVLMSVIFTQSQIYIRNGLVKHIPKPLYTFGCNNTILTNLTTSAFAAPITAVDEQPFWLFRISFQYYILISTINTVIVGSLISWLTRRKDDPSCNPDHLSPIVGKYYKPQYKCDGQTQECKFLNGSERTEVVNDSSL